MEQKGEIGNVGSYDLKFEGGVASIEVMFGPVTNKTSLPAKAVIKQALEYLKTLTPDYVDKIVDVIENAVEKL